jgi:hypothetical protein
VVSFIEQRVDRVTFFAFEVIAFEPVILFFVGDHWLDRVPTFESLFQCLSFAKIRSVYIFNSIAYHSSNQYLPGQNSILVKGSLLTAW